MRIVRIASLVAILVAGCAAAAAAEGNNLEDTLLLGGDPGTERAFACFSRVFDAAHLASHPDQNVTAMTLLVDSEYDEEWGRGYVVSMGATFRGSETRFQTSGFCGVNEDDPDDPEYVGCGIECDGGHIGLVVEGPAAVQVNLPYGALMWDPQSGDEVPEGLGFAAGDEVFELQRADMSECLFLEGDPDVLALLTR